MAETLPPDVLAKLERSQAALAGASGVGSDAGSVAPLTDLTEAQPDSPRPGSDEWRDRQDEPVPPLWWDGAGWTRRDPRPGEVVPPVNVFNEPIPERPIDVGWAVFHRTHMDSGGYQRSGLVFDVTDGDRSTGELATTYHLASLRLSDASGVRDVEHLVVVESDVAEAHPPRRAHIAEVVTACARLAARKKHAARRGWLLDVARVLERCAS